MIIGRDNGYLNSIISGNQRTYIEVVAFKSWHWSNLGVLQADVVVERV